MDLSGKRTNVEKRRATPIRSSQFRVSFSVALLSEQETPAQIQVELQEGLHPAELKAAELVEMMSACGLSCV